MRFTLTLKDGRTIHMSAESWDHIYNKTRQWKDRIAEISRELEPGEKIPSLHEDLDVLTPVFSVLSR